MKPGPDAVDQREVIYSDEQFEDEFEEQLPYPGFEPPQLPEPEEDAPWLITHGIGDEDNLDYAWSLTHYDRY